MELFIDADTVESAIYEGLKKLNKNRNDVKITVIEKGDKDFLGLTGSKKAKVKIEYADYPCVQPDIEPVKQATAVINSKNAAVNHMRNKTVSPEKIEETVNLLKELFEKINFTDIEFKPRVDDGDLIIEIISPDSSLIIGKHGKTLQAFQLIVNTIINNKHLGDKTKIILDSENYREKRTKTLEDMAEKNVKRLKYSKKDVFFPPMNNIERKIIHNYLSNQNNISTESIGVEPTRRIKISFTQGHHRKAF